MEKIKTKLMLDYPFFGTLALNMPLIKDPSVETLCTNGSEVRYAPEFTDQLTVDQKLFVYLHEIGHVILGHPFRRQNREHRLFNIAGDYAVNLLLQKATKINPPKGCLFDIQYDNWSTERIYEKLFREYEQELTAVDPSKDCDSGDGDGDGDSDYDQDNQKDLDSDSDRDNQKDSDSDSDSDSDQDNQEDQGQANNQTKSDKGKDSDGEGDSDDIENVKPSVKPDAKPDSPKLKKFKELIEASKQTGMVKDSNGEVTEIESDAKTALAYKATGAGKGAIEGIKEIVEDITETKISWESELSKYINETSMNYYNWSRPNQRYSIGDIIMPTLQSDDALEICVVIDTSGSIDMHLLGKFIKEFKSIVSAIEYKQIHVFSCHTEAYNWKTYDKGMDIDYEPYDWGGTEFAPAFELIKEKNINPACTIYFTDLQCYAEDFGPKPLYPVLWVGNYKNPLGYLEFTQETVPFGRMIDMKGV